MTPPSDQTIKGPFEGIRVLDFSRVLAGPLCGQFFADLGADVIKVEAPGGDENRFWEPLSGGKSPSFMAVNRGKRGITLDLKSDRGHSDLQRLLRGADVVIDSYLPADAKRLGLSHDSVRAANPDVIHVSISAYGEHGPMRDHPGYDLLLQAFTGIMQSTGEPGGPPNRAGVSVVDLATGMLAFGGAAAALYARSTGRARGEHVQASLLQTGMALMNPHVVNLTVAGEPPVRQGSGLWSLVPYQAFRTADGWVLLGVTNDSAWQRFCDTVGREDLRDTTAYATARGRIDHRSELVAAVAAIVEQRTVSEWIDVLSAAKIPCSPINTLEQALQEPQVDAIDLIVEVPDGFGGTYRTVGRPINFASDYPVSVVPPPLLGQDTDEVLAEPDPPTDKPRASP